MEQKELYKLLENLIKQPKESEWVEFKGNFHSAEEIGKAISSLANGAGLHGHQYGYLVFGVQDSPQIVTGTKFKFSTRPFILFWKSPIALKFPSLRWLIFRAGGFWLNQYPLKLKSHPELDSGSVSIFAFLSR